jgi:RNA polymerase sigma-70 factor (ECF subfamily)
MPSSQDTLVDRLRHGGTRPDWEQFVNRYGPLMERWARRLSRPDDADDLFQDTLLLAMQRIYTFKGDNERCFRCWLRTVMLNRWRELRRIAVARLCATRLLGFKAARTIRDVETTDALAADEHARLLVNRALGVMRSDFEPTTWRACWEKVAADRPASDVGAELGVSVDVVYSATHRVLRRLRSELAGPCE